jgi:hypothetical protein
VPTAAQDRVRRGPFAALLILLSLLLGSAGASAAGNDPRGPASRLGSSRQGTATALLPATARNPVEDETPGAGTGPSLPASAPYIPAERLWARPRADFPSSQLGALPGVPGAPYRARAPPAS